MNMNTIAKAETRDEIILIETRESSANDGDGVFVGIQAFAKMMKAPSIERISTSPLIALGEVNPYYQVR